MDRDQYYIKILHDVAHEGGWKTHILKKITYYITGVFEFYLDFIVQIQMFKGEFKQICEGEVTLGVR